MAKNMPDAAMPLGDSRSGGMGSGVDTGPEHGAMMGPGPNFIGNSATPNNYLGPNQIEPSPFYRRVPRVSKYGG